MCLFKDSLCDALLVADKVQEAMTAEEKEKLYAAIGYQESAAAAIYPKEVDSSALLSFYVPSRAFDSRLW